MARYALHAVLTLISRCDQTRLWREPYAFEDGLIRFAISVSSALVLMTVLLRYANFFTD